MGNKIKVVCPKCQAKLNLAVEKMKGEVVKFRCPGCSTVLRAKKPAQNNQKKRPPQQDLKESAKPFDSSDELQKLADEFEKEMDNVDSQLDELNKELAMSEHGKDQTDGQVPGQEKETLLPVAKGEDAPTTNLRKYKRVKFKQKVLVDNQIMVEALDISDGGLFLHTGRSFDDGSIVEVGIPTKPGNFDFKVLAKVQHNHRGIGMGMQFVGLDDSQKAELDRLIDSLDEAARKDLEGRKKILLVGGTDTARNINKSKLVLDGFYVMQATSIAEIYKILQAEPPDAMVLEWQETQFNCRELLLRIKENRKFDSIIIIVLSALTDTNVHKEIIDAGADRCMAKMDTNPVKLSRMLSALVEERDS